MRTVTKKNKLEVWPLDNECHSLKIGDTEIFTFDLSNGWYISQFLIDSMKPINEIQITIRKKEEVVYE